MWGNHRKKLMEDMKEIEKELNRKVKVRRKMKKEINYLKKDCEREREAKEEKANITNSSVFLKISLSYAFQTVTNILSFIFLKFIFQLSEVCVIG